jgi:hypothetical protein
MGSVRLGHVRSAFFISASPGSSGYEWPDLGIEALSDTEPDFEKSEEDPLDFLYYE